MFATYPILRSLAAGAALVSFALAPGLSHAEMDAETEAKLREALEAESRPEDDKARDRNRKPIETLEFFGFEDDMTVIELVPGGGWYTRLLMPTLADDGKLYLSIGTRGVAGLEGVPGFEEATVLDVAGFGERQPSGRFDVEAFSFGVEDVDLVLTFRNMHNFSAEGRGNINAAAFEALKSGGHYGVVDHTRRHMAPDYSEVRRRMDPVQIIKEVESAGFEFVDYSKLHYRPDDELIHEVGRATVTGNTDRFTFLFRKP